jgi:DNA-binding PadR family transcriptional regulator
MASDLTYIRAIVLHAIRSGQRYGFQIMAATELPSGTVYPALRRLEKSGLIRSRWERVAAARAEQRPSRKYYQVTPDGESALIDAGKRYRFPEIEAAQEEADR